MKFFRNILLGSIACLSLCPMSANADILITPTRIVMEQGEKSAELIFVNKSDEDSAFRISLENRRMLTDGSMERVEDALPGELFAKDMLRYSPRRVVLEPGGQQTIRISSRLTEGLEPGEYRSHLRVMAAPVSAGNTLQSLSSESDDNALSITLVAIQSVTIPVIVRVGKLDASIQIDDLSIEKADTETDNLLVARLTRAGNRSTYGDIKIFVKGEAEPTYMARGIAVYVPNTERDVVLPLPDEIKQKLSGQDVRIVYASSDPTNPGVFAEFSTRLP